MAIDSSKLDPSHTFWTGRGKSRGKFTRPGRGRVANVAKCPTPRNKKLLILWIEMVEQRHALFAELDITGTETAQRNPQMKNRKDRERQTNYLQFVSSCTKLAKECPYSTGCTSSVVEKSG